MSKDEILKDKMLKAYELVIADIAQDIGYVKGAQETTLSVLRGRVNEIKNVLFNDDIVLESLEESERS